jgi:formylglycine-generating enzyme required for sulfatase activity
MRLTIPGLFAMVIVPIILDCSESRTPSRPTPVDDISGILLPGVGRQIAMKDIPTGTFRMGSDSTTADSKDDEMPAHMVTVSAFKMQETEVTQEQFLAVMGMNLAYSLTVLDYGIEADVRPRPVETVTWKDAVRFCNALSNRSGFPVVYDTNTWTADFTSTGYRLPTEAEWEYACRAGSTTAYWWGADTNGLGPCAWSINNSSFTNSFNTHAMAMYPAASKRANSFGLYDMAGNAWEWCNDRYGGYGDQAVADPIGPDSGEFRVLRGGSNFTLETTSLRSAARYWQHPDYRYDAVGFRVARSL